MRTKLDWEKEKYYSNTAYHSLTFPLDILTVLTVHDGEWYFGLWSHPHKCYQVSELKGCWWQFCLQQRKGLGLTKLGYEHVAKYICNINYLSWAQLNRLNFNTIFRFIKYRQKTLNYVQDYNENYPKSSEGLDLNKVTAKEVISYYLTAISSGCITCFPLSQCLSLGCKIILFIIRKYGLDDNTVDFIGHELALHLDDTYLDQPTIDFVKRVKVLSSSIW